MLEAFGKNWLGPNRLREGTQDYRPLWKSEYSQRKCFRVAVCVPVVLCGQIENRGKDIINGG